MTSRWWPLRGGPPPCVLTNSRSPRSTAARTPGALGAIAYFFCMARAKLSPTLAISRLRDFKLKLKRKKENQIFQDFEKNDGGAVDRPSEPIQFPDAFIHIK